MECNCFSKEQQSLKTAKHPEKASAIEEPKKTPISAVVIVLSHLISNVN